MPASPPPDQPAPLPPPERFDPTTLDLAVIAIPLLEKINAEKKLIDEIREKYPEKVTKYNCVIALPRDKSVTSAAIKAALQKIIDEALVNAGAEVEALRSRHQLGERLPGRNALFAWLDARVIRRILNRQDVRRSRGEELPLIIERILPSRFKVIIDLNLEFIGGREKARAWVKAAIPVAIASGNVDDPGQRINEEKSRDTDQYVFATLEADVIARLVEMDAEPITAADLEKDWSADATPKGVKMEVLQRLLSNHPEAERKAALAAMSKAKLRAIYRIWPDFEVRTRITHSISTVKANAAINSFAARGADITWAVLDTGIQGDHPHFKLRNNILDPASPLHRNFTSDDGGPLIDANGHGTHVAGIIAGEWKAPRDPEGKPLNPLTAVSRFKDERGDAQQKVMEIEAISGMAPECRLVSLKVLDENGIGNASNLIAAIAHVQEINGHGRRLLIHGMNISIGYDFDPKWFACGQSPLCVEVDRLVKSGVVVVVAAGNTGYGAVNNGSTSAGLTVTINDPGNADLAITVGSTHRDMPHVYGVSYFSSKGPTGDGRLKPDLVAPGEKIVSCASALPLPAGAAERPPSELKREVARGQACDYIETSGTSMAAPHVSGLVAAFLSVRREFIGRPEQVKKIFVSTCTDLNRDRYFQGAGLIDLMRAIQSV
jgi:subtilisin family serine protease